MRRAVTERSRRETHYVRTAFYLSLSQRNPSMGPKVKLFQKYPRQFSLDIRGPGARHSGDFRRSHCRGTPAPASSPRRHREHRDASARRRIITQRHKAAKKRRRRGKVVRGVSGESQKTPSFFRPPCVPRGFAGTFFSVIPSRLCVKRVCSCGTKAGPP